MITAPDVIMYAIGAVLIALCTLAVIATQKKERDQQRRYAEYSAEQERRYTEQNAAIHRAHETNLKGNELIEVTNQLLRELIDEVRAPGPLLLDPSPRPSPPTDTCFVISTICGGEGDRTGTVNSYGVDWPTFVLTAVSGPRLHHQYAVPASEQAAMSSRPSRSKSTTRTDAACGYFRRR